MRSALAVVVVASVGLFLAACSSSEKGVKSNYMEQWTTVNANTARTTDAAKAVLEGEGLKEVNGSSTNVDGTASGKMSDGTKVRVSVKKEGEGSQVSVKVGSMGDPKLGAELARKIKDKAEAAA